MNKLQTIEIDFDIHQMIELERRGFDEPQYLALRRLLKLPDPKDDQESQETTSEATIGRAWSGKGVELPHGTKLRMEYNGRIFRGQIDNGEWVIEDNKSKSPSDAAGSVARTKDGKRPSLNGWNYWEVKRPTDKNWRALNNLRSR